MSFLASKDLETVVTELIGRYPEKRSASLMVLHAIQDEFGFISTEAMEWTAAQLDLQPINIYELVTFYPMFRREPAGRNVVKICRTLSCALGGSKALHGHVCETLRLNHRKHSLQTTEDGKFSVEFVECLAACGTAPVMMCNEDFHESVSHEKAGEILAKCK